MQHHGGCRDSGFAKATLASGQWPSSRYRRIKMFAQFGKGVRLLFVDMMIEYFFEHLGSGDPARTARIPARQLCKPAIEDAVSR